MTPTLSLVPVWTAILAFGVFFYVALDGFDLGVGMLYNFAPDRSARDQIMNSIAPIWDGNETWLILGGLGLLAAFPVAFAIIIPAVYFPIVLMLLALICIRIPLSRRRIPDVLGSWFCHRLRDCSFCAGRGPWRIHSGFPGRGARVYWWFARLLHAVFRIYRAGSDGRLRVARCRLAGD
jgi:hypothetical protein